MEEEKSAQVGGEQSGVGRMNPYERLARKLDALPNGYPPAEDGSHLRLLEKIFSREEAEIACLLTPDVETAEEIARRADRDPKEVRQQLRAMAKRGVITIEINEGVDRYGLMPFVVGIYENQVDRMDRELAELFEAYYLKAFARVMQVQPQFQRVVPVGETIQNTMEVHPYENIIELVNRGQSWAVLDCICRKQKALIGQACKHPIDVCMAMSPRKDAFLNHPVLHAVSKEEALATLRRAAEAGLVHTVSNNQEGVYYICNCCTCSCGILRGMAELGMANVIARSAFVCRVEEALCSGCATCLEYCQFGAVEVEASAQVNATRCVGCGVCVAACPSSALRLVRRPEEEIKPIPQTAEEWKNQRASFRTTGKAPQ